MTENIQVTCLTDRYWDPVEKTYNGTEKSGTLIELSLQSTEENAEKLIPVGIVVLSDNLFQAIPVEFIKKTTTEI